MDNKKVTKISLAAIGALAIGMANAGNAAAEANDLGNGAELRGELLGFGQNLIDADALNGSIELSCGEKSKESKCGEKKEKTEKTEKKEKNASEKKSKKKKEKTEEHKCGEGKCGGV